jgi:hypothetical protein
MNDAATGPEFESAGDVELLETAVGVDVGLEPESEAEPDAEPRPEAEPEPEPEAGPEAEPVPEPEPEAEPEAEPEPLTLDELVAEIARSEAEPGVGSVEPEPVEDSPGAAEEAGTSEPDSTEEPAAPKPLLRRMWTRIPFWAVDGVWFVLTAAAVIALWRAPSATFTDGIAYALLVLGGAVLAFIGLVSGLVVWLVARSRASEDERVGLGLSIWTRALAWTAGGVALWWVGLLLLDLHHAGVIG